MKVQKNNSILLICAMKEEIEPLLNALKLSAGNMSVGTLMQRTYKQITINCLITGVGRRQTYKRLKEHAALIQESSNNILIGVCGAIDSSFAIGDIFIPSETIGKGKKPLPLLSIQKNNRSISLSVHDGGTLFTGDNLMQHTAKKLIGNTFPSVKAVDMETYYVADYFYTCNKSIVVIKAISDTCECILPDETFLRQLRSKQRFIQKLFFCSTKPRETTRLYKLQKAVSRATKSNAKFVKSFIDSIL